MTPQRCPVFCTVVSKQRLAFALRLGRDIATLHPGHQLVVLLVDDLGGHRSDQDDLVFMRPDDLPIKARVIHELAMCLHPDDLAASLAPALLHELLRRQGDRSVVYLDPDTVVLSALDDLDELARASGIVLTPRLLSALPNDKKEPTERDIIALGSFDPGCVGVAHGAETFLTWWEEALSAYASVEGAHPSSVQPFLDLAPTIFSVRTLSDPRYGVAYWNAHERAIAKHGDDAIYVGSHLAKTVHLKGFSPETPSLLSTEAATSPRVLLSEYPALAKLCREVTADYYALLAKDADAASPFSVLGDGCPVDDRMRRLMRRARKAGGFGNEEVPDPYSSESINDFYDWLASPEKSDPLVPLIPRYLHEVVADRFDLSWSFQRLGTVDALRFREWVENHGLDEEDLPDSLRRAIKKSAWWDAPLGVISASPDALHQGVTFAGYLQSSIGVGEAGRLVLDAMTRSGIQATPLSTDGTSSTKSAERQKHSLADRSTNVVWVNADQLPGFASVVGPAFFDGRYTIGGWVWETERLPKETAESAAFVDEIWVPSDYVRRAVAPMVNRPVYTFPYPVVEPPHGLAFNRASHRIPPGYMFLFVFDFLSSAKRKNPLGLIDAYTRAFATEDEAVLVLKCVNGEKRLADLEELRLAVAGRRDIVVLNHRMESASRGALLAACDCFVSLHHSEGFGLSLAEAMMLAKPVIATGYSGNLEFMDESCSYLVPATSIPVGLGADPYLPDDVWADPDLDVAAEMMQRVVANSAESQKTGVRARTRMAELFHPRRSTEFLTTRMAEIERRRADGYLSSAGDAARALV